MYSKKKKNKHIWHSLNNLMGIGEITIWKLYSAVFIENLKNLSVLFKHEANNARKYYEGQIG